MEPKTTAFAFLDDHRHELITGTEVWPVLGKLLPKAELAALMKMITGYNLYYDCNRKAEAVRKVKGFGYVVGGAVMVLSAKSNGAYGHYWNPPFEFHAWWSPILKDTSMIVDLALPGLIMLGSKVKDSVGYVLEGRDPMILAGKPRDWMMYHPVEEMEVGL